LERPQACLLAAPIARGLLRFHPLEEERAQGRPGCTLHPRSRVRFAQTKLHTSIQVQAEHPGLPCAMALRLTSCSPVTGFLASVAAQKLPRNLMPAPRRRDHTTSPYASCQPRPSRLSRPLHPTGRFRLRSSSGRNTKLYDRSPKSWGACPKSRPHGRHFAPFHGCMICT